MSSVISNNLQITVLGSDRKTTSQKTIMVSINDYYTTGGVMSATVQLTPEQAILLRDLLTEKLNA